jgi:hypothetical protein
MRNFLVRIVSLAQDEAPWWADPPTGSIYTQYPETGKTRIMCHTGQRTLIKVLRRRLNYRRKLVSLFPCAVLNVADNTDTSGVLIENLTGNQFVTRTFLSLSPSLLAPTFRPPYSQSSPFSLLLSLLYIRIPATRKNNGKYQPCCLLQCPRPQ